MSEPRPARAIVKDDWQMAGVEIPLIWRDARLNIEQQSWVRSLDDAAEPDVQNLRLPEDAARALYEALAEHFGHAGHDIRNLRRDYDAERGRVDRLIGALLPTEPKR